MSEENLAPWEVPPDESYWQALLQEEEDSADSAVTVVVLNHELEAVDPAPTSLAAPAPVQAQSPPPPVVAATEEEPLAHSLQEAPGSPVAPAGLPEFSDALPGEADARSLPDVEPMDEAAFEHASEPPSEEESTRAEASPLPLEHEDSWRLFCQYRDKGETVELIVESYNRGGLLVRWEQVVGFVPASQLCDGLRYGDEQDRLSDLATRVGGSLTLKVIEVDPDKNRLILSERAARHVEDPDLDMLDELDPGDICQGQVTNLCTFGAFVDLGGVEGLVHISELSWGRVSHPSDILQSGQQVEVYVLNVDRDQGRVGLSLKRLLPDPWSTVQERYAVGQVLEGEITNIVNFGAFVRLEEGLEGLIHTSELNGAASGAYALREGEHVLVRINSIESERHRIGLSLE